MQAAPLCCADREQLVDRQDSFRAPAPVRSDRPRRRAAHAAHRRRRRNRPRWCAGPCRFAVRAIRHGDLAAIGDQDRGEHESPARIVARRMPAPARAKKGPSRAVLRLAMPSGLLSRRPAAGTDRRARPAGCAGSGSALGRLRLLGRPARRRRRQLRPVWLCGSDLAASARGGVSHPVLTGRPGSFDMMLTGGMTRPTGKSVFNGN